MNSQQPKHETICPVQKNSENSLVNICDVKIDASLPGSLRMAQYLKQIQNPYYFLCGDTLVHLLFANEGQELSETLVRYFCALKVH